MESTRSTFRWPSRCNTCEGAQNKGRRLYAQHFSLFVVHAIVVQLPCRQHIKYLAYIGPHACDKFIHDVRRDSHLFLKDNCHYSRAYLGSVGPGKNVSVITLSRSVLSHSLAKW